MNLFANYAAEAIPLAVQRKQAKAEKPPSLLDLKMQEKQRLAKSYRLWKRDHARAVLEQEPRLKDFARFLRKASDGHEITSAIAESWLPTSHIDIRLYALRLVMARCDRLDREAGFEALDDPLPPERTTYFDARDLLHPGGAK